MAGYDDIVSGVQTGLNIVNSAAAISEAEKNRELQEKYANYQQQLNDANLDWQFNKYFYSSQDLSNAGFSKAALLNQAPTPASVLSSPNAPQYDFASGLSHLSRTPLDVANILNTFQQADTAKMEANYKQQLAYTETINRMVKLTEAILNEEKVNLTKETINKLKKEIEVLDYDFNFSKEHGIRSFDAINNIYNTLKVAGANFDNPAIKEFLSDAIDVLTFFIPGAGLLKGSKLIGKALPMLKTMYTKGKDWTVKNWNKLLKRFGLKKEDLPAPSDFFG